MLPPVPRFAAALSLRDQSPSAAQQAAELAAERGGLQRTDLAFVFLSRSHAEHAEEISSTVRKALNAECIIGCTARGIIGGTVEAEADAPALAVLAGHIPGLTVTDFTDDDLPPTPDQAAEPLGRIAEAVGYSARSRTTIFFADAFSVPLVKLLPALNAARSGRDIPILGGLASSAEAPGQNRLILNERTLRQGLVGVTLDGPFAVETVVSQGCRPIGPEMVITRAKGNLIQSLGGKPAVGVVAEVVEGLSDPERALLEQGLFIGRVVSEYKERHGPGDYLIRNVLGAETESGSIAVGDLVRAGQTIRFHIRDAAAASDDLDMILAAHRMDPAPLGALLISCTGRGLSLFKRPSHDARAIASLFAPPISGTERAKAGEPISPDTPPIAGFFAAGEIGPVGGQSYLHSHTASAALFRPARSASTH